MLFPRLRRIVSSSSKRRPHIQSTVCPTEVLEAQRQMLAADLTISEAAYTSIDPTSLDDVNITVNLTIGNIGDSALIANDVAIQAVISIDNVFGNGDDVGAGFTFIDLSLLANTADFGSVAGSPSLANYQAANFLLIKIDNANVVAESNENNNVISLDLPGLPTLTTSQGVTIGKTNKPIIIDSQITFTDSDTSDFADARLTVLVDNDAEDVSLSMKKFKTEAGLVKIKKGELKLGKNVIGTVTGGTNSEPMQFAFTQGVTAPLIQQIARSMTMRTIKGADGDRVVRFRVTDGDNFSSFSVFKAVTATV